MAADSGMLSNFLVVSTFPVLPVTPWLRIREMSSVTSGLAPLTSVLVVKHPEVGDQERMAPLHFIIPLAPRREKPLRKPRQP